MHARWTRVWLLGGAIASLNFISVSGFATKRRKSSSRRTIGLSPHRGFGQAPPTLDEILATFKTRLPETQADAQPCPCGISEKKYGDCCRPYHNGKAVPLSPLAVLQSRYSAFAYRNVGYILQTTHQSCRDYNDDKIAWAKDMNKNGMFDSYDFIDLKVLKEEFGGYDIELCHEAYIEFQVTLRARSRTGSLLEGQETVIQERSKFIRDSVDGGWLYASGDVRSTVQGVDDIILNK